jgi:hypothetical protein
MNLQTKLNSMREQFESGMPRETKEIMHKATEDLAKSGIIEDVLKPGEPAPEFTLQDEQQNEISSGILLKTGPLVVSFYRGVW